jgi:prepilin-type N-terminal cleavage/methylation domain-containing protein
MLRQRTTNKRSDGRGFTLIEVLVSISILAIGLLGVAALLSSMLLEGSQSRYMNIANVLASEKLDTLNKWPSTDPNVCDASSCASAVNSAYCAASSCGTINGPAVCVTGDPYCDQVVVSETSGLDYETQTQVVLDPVSGTVSNQTTTIVQTSSGCVGTPANCGVAQPPAGGATFTRRWLITENPTITSTAGAPATVTGGRRITVLVTLQTLATRFPVSFQMSMVRP